MDKNTCPICESGQLHQQEELVAVEHMGTQGQIKSVYSVCDCCGSEQAGTNEVRINKRAMIAFKKKVQGLLVGAEVRKLRKSWGFSQEQAAKVFGGGKVAFSKYESDDVMQAESMDKLLRVARDVPDALASLKAAAGVTVASHGSYGKVVSMAQHRSKTQRLKSINLSNAAEEQAHYG